MTWTDATIDTPTIEAARLVLAGRDDLVLHDGCNPLEGVSLATLDLGFPDVRDVEYPRADQDGSDDETAYIGPRVVSVTLDLFNAVELVGYYLDRLRSFCAPNLRPSLIFKLAGQDERSALLRTTQQSAPLGLPRRSTVGVGAQWRCPDGILVSTLGQLVAVNPAGTTEPGRAYDLTHDRVYPTAAIGGQLVTVGGTVNAAPVIRIFGPCTNPRVENVTLGRKLEFTASGGLAIAAGDYLELNVRNRTARLNGSAAVGDNRYKYLNFAVSKWWTLAPGDNVIRYYPVTSSAPSVAELAWNDAWL